MLNASLPRSANYQMTNDPSGAVDLHWWFNNVPVALARPFFMGGDPRLDVSVNNSTDMVRDCSVYMNAYACGSSAPRF